MNYTRITPPDSKDGAVLAWNSHAKEWEPTTYLSVIEKPLFYPAWMPMPPDPVLDEEAFKKQMFDQACDSDNDDDDDEAHMFFNAGWEAAKTYYLLTKD